MPSPVHLQPLPRSLPASASLEVPSSPQWQRVHFCFPRWLWLCFVRALCDAVVGGPDHALAARVLAGDHSTLLRACGLCDIPRPRACLQEQKGENSAMVEEKSCYHVFWSVVGCC